MWIFLNDAFLSIVDAKAVTSRKKNKKTSPDDVLIVRARVKGDIERVFGQGTKVVKTEHRDYHYRALIPRSEVQAALTKEVNRINYGNFKDSVANEERHDHYGRVWSAMYSLQQKMNGKKKKGFQWPGM